MYPLPPELEQKVWQANRRRYPIPMVILPQDIFNAFAALIVRENRRLRQQVAELWREFSETSDRDDLEYGSVMAAAGGEFTCEHIVNEILKPNVYFNTKDAADRAEEVERFIEGFNAEID